MENTVIALGFFDGAHLGHQQLFRAAREAAEGLGARTLALTFDRHPEEVVFGEKQFLLNTKYDRARLISRYMDEVRFLRFNEEFMRLPWERFVDEICIGEYGARHLVCGEDYRFGYKGQGCAGLLQKKCASLGLGCSVVPQLRLDGTVVSSTHIRSLVKRGELAEAAKFLGHSHILTGAVVHGRGLGAKNLVPTANFPYPDGVAIPPRGVYATKAGSHAAVTNIGLNPTAGALCSLSVETYLIGFSGDLYGRELTLEFTRFLRPEQKFSTLEALKRQILIDSQNAQL